MNRLRLVAVRIVTACALAIALCACESEWLSISVHKEPDAQAGAQDGQDALGRNPDSNLIRLGEGSSVIVSAIIIRPEIEGSTAFKVETLRADDPAVVDVAFVSTATFRLTARKPGETIIRAAIDGDERAVVPVRVLARPYIDKPSYVNVRGSASSP